MITAVYLWSNGMVMVFDEHGQQMPAYQGKVAEVREKILRDAPESARFGAGRWGFFRPHCNESRLIDISRETFAELVNPPQDDWN